MLLPSYSMFSILSILEQLESNNSLMYIHLFICPCIHHCSNPFSRLSLWFLKQVKKGLLTLVVRTRLGALVGSQTQVAQLCRSKSLSSTAGINRASDDLTDFPNLGTHAKPRDRIMMEITLQKGQYKNVAEQQTLPNTNNNMNFTEVWKTWNLCVCVYRDWCGSWYWVVLRSIC